MEQEFLSQLSPQFKRLRLLYLLCLALAALALAACFFDRRAALAILGLNLLLYLLGARPRVRAYQRDCIQASIRLTLSRYLDGAVYASPALTPADIRAPRLVAADDSPKAIIQKEGGRGRWQGREVRLGEVILASSFYSDAQRRKAEYLTGTWVRVELAHDTGLDCRLICRDLMDPRSRAAYFSRYADLRPTAQELPSWLAEGWVVITGREDALPPAHVLDRLKKLADYTPAPMAAAITGNILSVYLCQRLLWRKVSIRQAPSEQWLNFDLLPELEHLLKIAGQL